MSAVSLSAIRQRFSAAVKTIPGFTESRNPLDPQIRQPDTLSNLRFAVGIGGSVAREDSRQLSPVGAFMETSVEVRFTYRLRPKDQVTDYDGSMDQAELIIKKILDRGAPLYTNIHIRLDRMIHNVTDSGEYIITSLEFAVLHHLPLT